MRPIDKFEWTVDELDILEYADSMNCLCSQSNQYKLIPEIGMDTLSCCGPGFSKKLCPFAPALEIFSNRYNEHKIGEHLKYENYLKQTEIQEYLEYFGLDKDKFWFMLLFAYDFSITTCFNGISVAESTQVQLQKFLDTILPHVKSFDYQYGSTFDTKIEMSIRVKGVKGTIKIDSPTALHFLADSCKKRIEDEKLEEKVWMQYQEIQEESASLKDSPTIFFFANMFLKWFNSQESVYSKRRKGAKHSAKERILISRLIYFTRISTEEIWLTDDEILKSFLKQYKEADFWNRTSNIYPEFLL